LKTDNYCAVPLREFKQPMDWVSDAALEIIHAELHTELEIVHKEKRSLAAVRNGLRQIEAEISRRLA